MGEGDGLEIGNDDDYDVDDDDDEKSDTEADTQVTLTDNSNKFGFINDEGMVVYVDLDDEISEEMRLWESSICFSDSKGKPDIDLPPPPPDVNSIDACIVQLAIESTQHQEEILLAPLAEMKVSKATGIGEKSYKTDSEAKISESLTCGSMYASYFGSLNQPCPRINPCLVVRGNTVYIYGGVTELGEVEVVALSLFSLHLLSPSSFPPPSTLYFPTLSTYES